MSDAIEVMSLNENSLTNERKYATREDFETLDQYATYVRSIIMHGMIVRCCEDFEEIQKGDIGTVEKVEIGELFSCSKICPSIRLDFLHLC